MGKKDTPDVPDYRGAAEETAASSERVTQQQTFANRPDQYTPWGSQTWDTYRERDPTTGQMMTRWKQTSNVDPELQRSLNAEFATQRAKAELGQGMLGRMESEYGTAMDWGQFGDLQGLDYESGLQGLQSGQEQYTPGAGFEAGQYQSGLGDIDPNQFRQQASDAMYGEATSRLDPRFEQQGEALEVKLRNQGLRAGDQAYDAAMGNFEREKSDAYSQAQNQAMLAGRGEAAQMYEQQTGLEGQRFGQFTGLEGQRFGQQMGMEDQRYGQFMGAQGLQGQRLGQEMGLEGQRLGQAKTMAEYANKLRQSGMAEEMQKRGFSLNEINAIISGQQVAMPNMPGFESAQRSETTDYSGAASAGFEGEMAVADLKQKQQQAMMDAASGIAGGAMMMSDRRLKQFAHVIGTYLGYPLYVFQYVWGEMAVGVMSDEVNPEAVMTLNTGYDAVILDKLTPMYTPEQGYAQCHQE